MTEKECYQCNELKELECFVRDERKPYGRGYICKKCHNENNKEVRKKKQSRRTKMEMMHMKMHMMTDDIFELYYNDKEIGDFLKKNAIRLSKHDVEFQKDLKQIGWAHIAMCESNKANEYYMKIAGRAMHNEYNKKWLKREYRLSDEELMTKQEYEMWRRGIYP